MHMASVLVPAVESKFLVTLGNNLMLRRYANYLKRKTSGSDSTNRVYKGLAVHIVSTLNVESNT